MLRGHNGPVRCVDFGALPPRGAAGEEEASLLITASDDKTVKLWRLPDAKFVCSLVGHRNWVRVAKFCRPPPGSGDDGSHAPLSRLAASGGDDDTVRIWTCDRAANLVTYPFGGGGAGSSVRDLDFFPAGTSLAACGTDGGARTFDLRSDAVVRRLDCNQPSGALSTVDRLAVHPDGLHLLCSTSDSARDGRVLMFDLRAPSRPLFDLPSVSSIGSSHARPPSSSARPTSAAARRRRGHGSVHPTSVAFAPDGARFATALKDDAVRVYRWSGGARRGEEGGGGAPHDAGRPRHEDRHNATGRRGSNGNVLRRGVPRAREIATKDVAPREVAAPRGANDDDDDRRRRRDGAPVRDVEVRPRSTAARSPEDLPEILASTLDRLVGQLDLLARTVVLLERRLTQQEAATERRPPRPRPPRSGPATPDGGGGARAAGVEPRPRPGETDVGGLPTADGRPERGRAAPSLPRGPQRGGTPAPVDSRSTISSLSREEEEDISRVVERQLQQILEKYSLVPKGEVNETH